MGERKKKKRVERRTISTDLSGEDVAEIMIQAIKKIRRRIVLRFGEEAGPAFDAEVRIETDRAMKARRK